MKSSTIALSIILPALFKICSDCKFPSAFNDWSEGAQLRAVTANFPGRRLPTTVGWYECCPTG